LEVVGVPELPGVSEDFTADASGYVAAVQLMIDRTKELISEVNTLQAAIDALPDMKQIEIAVAGNAMESLAAIKEELDSLDNRTLVVNVIYRNIGGPGDVTHGTIDETVDVTGGGSDQIREDIDALSEMTQVTDENTDATDLQSAAQEVLGNILRDSSLSAQQQAAALKNVTAAMREARLGVVDMTSAAQEEADAFYANLTAIHGQITALGGQSDAAEMSVAAMEREALAAYNVDQAISQARAEIEEITAAENAYRDSLGEVNDAEERAAANQIEMANFQEQLIQKADNASAAVRKQAAVVEALEADLGNANDRILQSVDSTLRLTQVDNQLAAGAALLADAEVVLGLRARDSAADLDYFRKAITAAGGNVDEFNADISGGMGTLLAFAMAAKRVGDNVGGVMIPITAASFGITGLGTAIHLITMGVFEFLAVFVPAMIAAAAGAAVMLEGVGQVTEKLQGAYIAAEALGPMFNTTAGDMLGLGHTLQTAQSQMDPGVYELLGAAINGVRLATGPATNGISSFGQMGEAVVSILDKFAASIDVELGSSMGQLRGLIAGGVTDLVEFGQILGNIGHTILNLASDMPGLAEVLLHVIDMFTQLLKWVSSLNPTFIAVIFGFEEAYRWSGLLAGGFALLGRAIALVGTLGLPVIAKIGFNMGAMASSVLLGIGGLITNFSALATKVGIGGKAISTALSANNIGDEAALMSGDIDVAASGIVSGLGRAAAFMTGPWGAAIMLAVGAITVFTIFMLRSKSATQEWISTQQQAVSAASNLTVLNTIGSAMAATTQKIAAQTQILNQASQQNSTLTQTQALEFRGIGAAANQAGGNIKDLTNYQQQLFGQSQNVIQGAIQISQQYGVNFTAALGLADAANVKLANGFVGSSNAEKVAQQEIANLYDAYKAMDQTGSTLSNTMQAIGIQAGLQATKVSQVNSAWDNFMSNATGLTGSFSQLNLDLQQMGNIAPAVGAKITAFSGATTMSVSQIAESLKGFSGQSAQTWQAYDQSLSGAETFTDSLRTAAAAGQVTQQQYQQAISGVVNMLLPYAKNSSAAQAELSVLVQEAGGPAITSFQGLKNWVDQTGGSTANLGGLIDTLTGKMSNVTQVAKNFAGTLQSDVLSAIANAAVGTSSITGLTQKYTQSLVQNGAQAPQTMQAQQALMGAMQKLGFTQTEAQQTTNELSSAYDLNTGKAGKNTGQTDQVTQAQKDMKEALGQSGAQAQQTTNGPLQSLNQMTQNIHQWTIQLEDAMKKWPSNEATKVTVTGTGGASIHSSIPGVSGGSISISQFGLGLAGGGVIPGYSPGHDTVPAMLSPGEGILTPDAVRAIGGAAAIHQLNAQHFAGGGIALPNVSGTATGILGAGTTAITDGFKSVMTSVMSVMQNDYNKYAQTAFAGVSGTVAGWLTAALKADGAPISWLPALAWLTNAESSGNPLAVDPIKVEGENATGLLQTLPSTFWAYENPSVPGGILNPVANAAAAIRYIESVYGTPFNIPGMFVHDKGYDSGGWLMPGLTLAHNNTGQPERVIGPNGGGDDGGVNHVHVYLDGKQIWENQQRRTLQYDARNNGSGNISGAWAPNRRGSSAR
jgi:SLT domain-containing protein